MSQQDPLPINNNKPIVNGEVAPGIAFFNTINQKPTVKNRLPKPTLRLLRQSQDFSSENRREIIRGGSNEVNNSIKNGEILTRVL